MTTKDKLDLLWKYLLLIVLAYGFYQMGCNRSPFYHHSSSVPGHEKMIWTHEGMDANMDIDVQVERFEDGDSSIVIKVNGEVIDLSGMDLEQLEDLDSKVFIKKMQGKNGAKRQIKIIKTGLDSD
jgi:hypothetical protein